MPCLANWSQLRIGVHVCDPRHRGAWLSVIRDQRSPLHSIGSKHHERPTPMSENPTSQLERNFAALEQAQTLLDNALRASLTSPAPRGRIYWFSLEIWDWVATVGEYRRGIVAGSLRRRIDPSRPFHLSFPGFWKLVSGYPSPVNSRAIDSVLRKRKCAQQNRADKERFNPREKSSRRCVPEPGAER